MIRYARLLTLLLTLAFVGSELGYGQPSSNSQFDPSRVWTSSTQHGSATLYRLGNGRPGPSYWQNHASYTIEARLDTEVGQIDGHVTLKYTNNSPSSLSSLWLYTGSSTSKDGVQHGSSHISIQSISIGDQPSSQTSVEVVGTRTQVRLPSPISAKGGTVRVSIDYKVPISENSLPKRGRVEEGVIYAADDWYPRVLAYTVEHGWARPSPVTDLPFTEYGSVDYSLTVPASMIVAGSGTLMNPDAVLTSDQRRRLMRARDSKRKVAIITPDNAGNPDTRPTHSGSLTWRFQMNGVRNVGWAASPSFIWNAARIARPEKRDALAMSYYPRSSMGGEAWNRATYHAQKSASFFSRRFYTYPWNNVAIVATPTDDRAVPGLSFCPYSSTGYALFACSVRNQSRNWVGAVTGPNVERHQWMREGFGTYLSVLAHRHLYDGEFAPKRDVEFGSPGQTAARSVASLLESSTTLPIHSPLSTAADDTSGTTAFRTAYGLLLLREYILDPTRFDYAFEQYLQRWAFRSPRPRDFYRTIEDAAGDDLSWFWRSWFKETWSTDLAITHVRHVDGRPSKEGIVSLSLRGKMPLPAELQVEETDGDTTRVRVPVTAWKDGPRDTVRVTTDSRIASVVIDPRGLIPDSNPADNTWSKEALRSSKRPPEE